MFAWLLALVPGVALAQQPSPASGGIVALGALGADADGDFVPDRVGDDVLVAGRVVAGTGLVRADVPEVYVQDPTGGLRVRLAPGSPPLLTGDSVQVQGVAQHRLGMLEMNAPRVRVIEAPPRAIEARRLRVEPRPDGGRGPDLEGHEGEYVEVEGTAVQVDSLSDGRQVLLLVGSTLVSVYGYRMRADPIGFDGIGPGDYVRVRGVAAQNDPDPPYNSAYRVYPLDARAVRRVGLPPATVQRLALGVGVLLVAALLWAVLLRREVGRRRTALEASETRYRHLFDAAADPVLVLDGERGGRVLQANHAAQRALGIGPDGTRATASRPGATADAPRRVFALPEVAADPPEVLHHVAHATRHGAATAVLELTRADGRTVPFEFVSRRLHGEGGDGTLVAVARDVEERRVYELGLLEAMQRADEARSVAEAASRLKETLLANMSHELRTPLTAILGYSEILCEEVPTDLQEYAEAIRAGGQRLLATLSDILDLARLDSEPLGARAPLFDPADVVRAAADAAAPAASSAGLALHVAAEPDEAGIAQPREAFQRVVSILIGNAIKFTEQGEVRVSLHEAPEFVAVRVQDTGVGIGEEFLPALFEPFTQESDGQGRRFEGNGLGLAIAKHLVDRMGGEIRVWSRKDEGSLFEVVVPRTAPHADPEPPAADGDASDWSVPPPALFGNAVAG